MDTLIAIVVGFLSGLLAGHFGIGGGILTTPAIRLILGQPAAIALGTPLPAILPITAFALFRYSKARLVDWRLAFSLMPGGAAGAILGSFLTGYIPAKIIMVITAVILALVGFRFVAKAEPGRSLLNLEVRVTGTLAVVLISLSAGIYAGFLGLAGGVILVPGITLFLKRDIKEAFAVSLAVMPALIIPGSIIHEYLGHVDLLLALKLAIGGIAGAYLGAAQAVRISSDNATRAFGIVLIISALYFLAFELVTF